MWQQNQFYIGKTFLYDPSHLIILLSKLQMDRNCNVTLVCISEIKGKKLKTIFKNDYTGLEDFTDFDLTFHVLHNV